MEKNRANDAESLEDLGVILSLGKTRPGRAALAEGYKRLGNIKSVISALREKPTARAVIESELNSSTRAKILESALSSGLNIVSIFSDSYPELLRESSDPPSLLFIRGGKKLSELPPTLAIVGSRKSDSVGCEIATQFAKVISERGATVVSGLALGIDAAAHRGSLKSSSKFPTVAVLGNGLASVYPKTHERLAQEIVERGGILVSEFEPGEPPYPSNFLQRNRIISGLSYGVIVIQATDRSGSLVTARYGLEDGRDVMVVPGSVLDPRFSGSNSLIRQGATLVTTAEEALEAIPTGLISTQNKKEVAPTPPKSALTDALKDGTPRLVEELILTIGPRGAVERELMELELEGWIVRLPGNEVMLRPTL